MPRGYRGEFLQNARTCPKSRIPKQTQNIFEDSRIFRCGDVAAFLLGSLIESLDQRSWLLADVDEDAER